MKTEAKAKKERVTWGDVFPKSRMTIIDNGKIKRIRIEGARKLLLCLPSEVKILLSEEVLLVSGETLVCTSYASGAIEVDGCVERISFGPRTERGRGR